MTTSVTLLIDYSSAKVMFPYMWTQPHLSGVTRISENLPAKKILLDITHIRSE